MKTGCFTGHRPQKVGGFNEPNPIADAVKRSLKEAVRDAKSKGFKRFISGMALGVDIWAAEIVLEDSELILVAALPCLNQDIKWRPESKKRYHEVLSKAHETFILAQEYTSQCMLDRNIWMVDNSELVIAVYDGTKGGTGHTVNYARSIDKEVFIIDPRSAIV